MRPIKHYGTLVSVSVVALVLFFALSAAAAGAAEWSVKNGKNPKGEEILGVHTLKELGWNSIAIGPKEAKATEEFVLRTRVGLAKIVMKATEVLDGEGEGEDKILEGGKGSGKFKIQGLSVTQPANCNPPASITTNLLKFELTPVAGLLSGTALKFLPQAGKALFGFELAGAACPLAGINIEVNTTNGLYGETAAIRTLASDQPVEFTPGINTTAGGDLTVGTQAVELTGKLEFKLTGEKNMGKEWSPE